MKNLFIPVKYKQNLNKSVINQIKKLPNKIAICYSIQFEKQALMLRDLIKNKEIIWFGQILGCSKPDMPKNTQAIILIGQGKFHSISLEHETKIPVYQIENNKLLKASEQEVKKLEKRQKASYVNYLNQNEIGVIITNKPGQQRLKLALDIKRKLKNKKKTYLFLCNNINVSEFENFGLKSWINTACPRLDLDDFRIINFSNLNLG